MKPGDSLNKVTNMLAHEYGTATKIKSRVNRLSVLSAITSAQQRLKLYNRIPTNGLLVYCGTIVTKEGKEKRVNIDFEPFKPVNTTLYKCDNKFNTEALNSLLEDNSKFGYIIVDGNGALFGTLCGNTREVLHKFKVVLPSKHGRGGQSASRFARLRNEIRHNYLRKVSETACKIFISDDKVNVQGIIIAGIADLKNELSQSDMFDGRLQAKVLNILDISYSAEQGFNEAIVFSSDFLSNVKFFQEQTLIKNFFEEVTQASGRFCYGIESTLLGLKMGAVEKLIVWENLTVVRYKVRNKETGEETELILREEQKQKRSYFVDTTTNADLEVIEEKLFLDYLTDKYKDFGTTLEIISDRSSEGNQFVQGYGGIGGILRYKVDFPDMEVDFEDDSEDDFDINDY